MKWIKFIIILAGLMLLLFICYLLVMLSSYVRHKKVSHAYMDHFKSRCFYSDASGPERIAYIKDNTEALRYRLNMIQEARVSIVLSTFDFNVDHAGKDVLAALLHAAEQGVDVKLIVDGISGFMDIRNDPIFQALAAQKNISVKIYNPLNFLRPWDLPARMHDKYLLIDDKMYLLGGRNTSDLFLGDDSKHKNTDRELFVCQTSPNGETSVRQLRAYFETVWSLAESRTVPGHSGKTAEAALSELRVRYEGLKPRHPTAFDDWDYESLTMPAGKVTLLSNPIEPKNKEPWMWYALCQLMNSARQVTVYTPYLICGAEMYADLKALTNRGVKIECIINDAASGANPLGCTDYMNQKRYIWSSGVKVYEYAGPHSTHTKAVAVDQRLSIIGSYNFDMRSTYQDTELMLAVDSPELNAMIRREAETDKVSSKVKTDEGIYEYGKNYAPKQLSTGKRAFYGFMRIIMRLFRRFL